MMFLLACRNVAGQRVKVISSNFRFCLQNVSGGGNPNIKKMLFTIHGELFRIFDTFCQMWKAGRQATLTTSTEGGMLKDNLDIQLGPPSTACPGDGER